MGAKISACLESPHSTSISITSSPHRPIFRFINLQPLNKNPLFVRRSKWTTVSFDTSTNDSSEEEEALPEAVNESFVKTAFRPVILMTNEVGTTMGRLWSDQAQTSPDRAALSVRMGNEGRS
jgi:hypothetical protein